MVFFFTSTAVDPPAFLYMGKDKYENEDLIAYGFEEDLWFHVDKLSSAHVYIRLPEGASFDDVPEDLLTDCAQLVKANSIEGCKHAVSVVYTPWSNLKKTADMAPGQVSYHDRKLVKKIRVEKKINAIVNRLNKTKEERYPDLREGQQLHKLEVKQKNASASQKKKEAAKQLAHQEREAKFDEYDALMNYGALKDSLNPEAAAELAKDAAELMAAENAAASPYDLSQEGDADLDDLM